jgi:DNA-binding transcriptional LysR family regulator
MDHLKGTIAFAAAARLGGFSAAARALDVSPQAAAASVARLEAALGVRLFNRTTRSVMLTDEGAAFLAEAEPALNALREATRAVHDRPDQPSGLVRISSGAAFGRRYVLPLLPQLAIRYPLVRVDLAMEDRKIDLVREGVDIALRGGAVADSSLVARRICDLSGTVVASPEYLAQHGTPRRVSDLSQHRLVLLRFASGQMVTWDFTQSGKRMTHEPNAQAWTLTLNDSEAVGEAAVLGLGIARVSTHFAWPHLKAGRLKVVLHSQTDPGKREMSLHYAHRQHLAPRIRAVVDFLLEAFAQDASLQGRYKDLAAFCA